MSQAPAREPSLMHVEPVLAVTDITASIDYYRNVLGFTQHWSMGEPPNHGGVSWNESAFIQFSLDPAHAKAAHGEYLWIRAKELRALYELHQKNNAEIVVPFVVRPWGFAEYTVKDLNGYYITFSERNNERPKSSRNFSDDITIIATYPKAEDVIRLTRLVGWTPSTRAAIEAQQASTVYSVIAQDTDNGEVVGCAFLVGDHRTFYYIKDVAVHPEWQNKGIGTAMMKHLMQWLETNGAKNATVGLFTGDHLVPFYKQFGFTQACGMYRQV